MGWGGIIAGALAGGASGVGKAMSENAQLEMKTNAELSLAEARSKLDQQRETALQEIRQAGQQKLQEQSQSFHAAEGEKTRAFQSGENEKTRAGQLARDKQNDESAERRHRESLSHSERIAKENRESRGVGERFTAEDGTVMEKKSNGQWEPVRDQGTGAAIKATKASRETADERAGRERENIVLRAKLDAAKKTLDNPMAKAAEKAAAQRFIDSNGSGSAPAGGFRPYDPAALGAALTTK